MPHDMLDTALARHSAKVRRIAAQLSAHRGPRPVSLRKKAVSHVVPKATDLKYSDETINISDLNEIIHIDPSGRTCVAECGVTFVDLVAETMKHGLVPIVVPELKTITIGGAVAGCSIESMSYVHGGFHDTCLEYEVITARGDIVTCTPTGDSLLFQMMHGTFGTLGVLSLLKFKLVPAKPFVRLNYEKYGSLAEYKAAIWGHYTRQDIDFMDGIIHSPHEYVLSTGMFVDEAPYTNRYDWMKVYYRSTHEREEDFLETPQYFFRYDRGVTNTYPKSALGRLVFGPVMGSSNVLSIVRRYHWMFLSEEHPMVTLDVFIPFSRVEEFLEWYGREFKYFPLWCVPYKLVHPYEWVADGYFNRNPDQLYLDLAIYGMQQTDGRNYYRIMEEKLMELGALKTLISYNYYSEEEFWSTWNRPNYEKVKAITDPNNIFRDLYTKTCRASRGLR
jgi:FAD/FMN-containing dehydrogenase